MATDPNLSDKKLIANRQNAQRSTGPRTAAGKATSSRNALTHGLFTKRDYVRPRERAEYRALGARFMNELRPEGAVEETLVISIVSAAWRLRRCSTVEYGLAADRDPDPMQHGYHRDTQNSVDRARSQSSLQLRRALLELRRLQTDRFLAQKLLAHEPNLPALVSPKQIVTVINQHTRRNLPAKSVGSNCSAPAQTPRNAACPCGSGEKFKRCCVKDAPPVLSPGNPGAGNPGEKKAA